MTNKNSPHKHCLLLILMTMLTEVNNTSELNPERQDMCTAICNFFAHYFEKEKCKEVIYRIYSFATTSQGYPDILSCDLNKNVAWLSDHVIIECHTIH